MPQKTLNGLFITFEGPERSGKSTQAKLLQGYLKKKGYECIFIREPGSTSLGERIRKILLDKKNTHISHFTEMLLYMAARNQLVKEVIEPALRQKKVIICDRFLDSTLAYQGYGLGMDKELIKRVGVFATNKIAPDITILLDMGNANRLQKGYSKLDRIESRSRKYHQKVRRGYLSLARLHPRRIKVVKMRKAILETQTQIRKIIDKCLLTR